MGSPRHGGNGHYGGNVRRAHVLGGQSQEEQAHACGNIYIFFFLILNLKFVDFCSIRNVCVETVPETCVCVCGLKLR